MVQIIRDVHGVPSWLMKEYLVELGGHSSGEQHVLGSKWEAKFYKIDDFKIGSIVIGRVRLEISGDEAAVEALMPRLELKLMRGGG